MKTTLSTLINNIFFRNFNSFCIMDKNFKLTTYLDHCNMLCLYSDERACLIFKADMPRSWRHQSWKHNLSQETCVHQSHSWCHFKALLCKTSFVTKLPCVSTATWEDWVEYIKIMKRGREKAMRTANLVDQVKEGKSW